MEIAQKVKVKEKPDNRGNKQREQNLKAKNSETNSSVSDQSPAVNSEMKLSGDQMTGRQGPL